MFSLKVTGLALALGHTVIHNCVDTWNVKSIPPASECFYLTLSIGTGAVRIEEYETEKQTSTQMLSM